MKNASLALLAVLGLSAMSFAQSAPMTGVWACNMKFDGGAMPDAKGQMDLKQEGKEVKGTGSSADGKAPMKGTFDDPGFKLEVVSDQAPWSFEGKLVAGKMVGNWAIPAMNVKGAFECSKPKAAGGDAASASITGLWKCVSKTPDGQPAGEFQLDLEQKGEMVTGTGANDQGKAPLKGTYADGKFKFVVTAGDTIFNFEGKIDGDKITGTMEIPAMSVKLSFDGKKS